MQPKIAQSRFRQPPQLPASDRRLRKHLRLIIKFAKSKGAEHISGLTYIKVKRELIARHGVECFVLNKDHVQRELHKLHTRAGTTSLVRVRGASEPFVLLASSNMSDASDKQSHPSTADASSSANTPPAAVGDVTGQERPTRPTTAGRLFGGFFSKGKKNDSKAKRHSLMRKTDVGVQGNDSPDEVVKPADDGVSFAYGCLVATMLGPTEFPLETDPEFKWRDNCLTLLLDRFELGGALKTMQAISHGDVDIDWTKVSTMIQSHAEPPVAILSSFIKLMAQSEGYDARARIVLFQVSDRLMISRKQMVAIESALASYTMLVEDDVSEEQRLENEKKKQHRRLIRNLKIGFGTIAGGVIIGVTGGLAAPLVAVGAGAALGTAAGTALATSGGIIAIGVLFGTGGAGLLAYKTNRRYGSLKEFEFKPIGHDPAIKSLGVVVNVAGWIPNNPDDEHFPKADYLVPFQTQDAMFEGYTLVWESAKLHCMAKALINFFSDQLLKNAATTVLKHTVFATLMAALVVPGVLIAASDILDNPWGVCLEASEAAGLELANVLSERLQGRRPVTLVGSSLGCLVIVTALKELAKRKRKDVDGMIQDVYLFGAPCSGKSDLWDTIMPLVAGRVICSLSSRDTFIKLMMRGLHVETCVAGLEGINHSRALNIDVSPLIVSHTDWVTQMPKLQHLAGLSTTYCDHPGYGHTGQEVHVSGLGDGIIRFCGWIDDKEPLLFIPEAKIEDRRCEWLGIALVEQKGDSNGSLKHGRYFDCPEGHGVFIPYHSTRVRFKTSRPGLATSTVQCYSPSLRSDQVIPHGSYSPTSRTHLFDCAKLAPRPDNSQITKTSEDENESKAWGHGRDLRQRKENPCLTFEELCNVKLRISSLEESAFFEAKYTIALSATAGEWTVLKSLSDFRTLRDTLLEEPGSGEVLSQPFPNEFFTSAKKRQPGLESWIKGVVLALKDMPFHASKNLFLFLGVTEVSKDGILEEPFEEISVTEMDGHKEDETGRVAGNPIAGKEVSSGDGDSVPQRNLQNHESYSSGKTDSTV